MTLHDRLILDVGIVSSGLHFLQNVRAHAHLLAEACVDHRVEVIITGNHRNNAASRCCMARLVLLGFCLLGGRRSDLIETSHRGR